jgi:Leucine-rich repeat (LRR) protein
MNVQIFLSNRTLKKVSFSKDIENIEHIEVDGNQLTRLPQLPPNLTLLWCNDNRLTKLPRLPLSLKKLYCHNNQLTKIPPLPPQLICFACENNPIIHLPQLPPSLEMLWVSPWQIHSCLNNLSNLKTSIFIIN